MKSMKLKKPKDGDYINKFADVTKSPKERLHAFLQAKDGRSKGGRGEDQNDGMSFLRDNHKEIMRLIYEAFWQYLDHVQLKKHKKSGTEEADLLEVILPTLERVLQYLPDKINDLWHYHGIARMLKEILTSANSLAPNNATALKRKGITLTVLWILGLMDKHKHSKIAVEVFNSILPELKHPEQDNPDKETTVSRFQFLLENLTCNIRLIHWPDVTEHELRERRIEGFRTVFNLCKKSYLEEILRGYEERKEGSSKHRSSSEHRYSNLSARGSIRRYEKIPEQHVTLPPRENRLERMHSSTSSHRSDAETPTSPMPQSLPQDDAFALGSLSYPEYEEIEQRCSKCRSAGHSTRSCPRCMRCKNQSQRDTDCPLIVEREVDNHFNKPMNELPYEQLDCIFQLNDKIMKWFVKHGKSILPHDKRDCMFVSKVDDVYQETENFDEEVEVCRIVDRVLFTDRDNIKLINDAFEHGPLVLQRRTESDITELMSPEEHQEFSFIKMITLYSELIYNIKDHNVLGHKTDNLQCPEFLLDSRMSSKKGRRQKNSQVERHIKSFLKSATLNVAPLLRYPYCYSTFSGPTKKMIESAANTTMGYYNVIVQQIEQADAKTCFRIILCMIKSIEHNFDRNFPIQSYEKQLFNLLHVVRFVGRKVTLPHNTWFHLRSLLLKLEDREETAPTANEFWHEVMKTLTQEIFVQVYGVEWKANSEKDEKAPKAKGKLQCHIEEKSHLTKFNAALSKLQRPFRSEKPTIQKSKSQSGERSHLYHSTEYHYHGMNKIFIDSVSSRNRNNQHWDDHHDDDDELRPNNGEHPIILWRRFLTLKGNPNTYAKSSVHHKRMFESLSDILDMLLWLDDNKDKQDRKHAGSNYRDNVPDHPVFTYIYHILPWFFEAFLVNPSEEFLPGKKAAMRMLCKCLVRSNPIKPPVPLLHMFYNVLLNCLKKEGVRPVEKISFMGNTRCYQKTRQDLLFEVVKGTKHLFSINLNGCQLRELMKCLSEGAISVLDAALASGPKADAIVLLGSLYTYPWTEEPLKQQIVVTIKDVARTESDQFNRSRAIQMLGYMIMTMLSKTTTSGRDAGPESPTQIINRIETSSPSEMSTTRSHNKYADAKNLIDLINIVMLQVRLTNSKVALSALSVVRDIADDFDKLLQVDSTLPKQIIEMLLSSLHQHMDAQRRPVEEYECDSPTKSSPTLLYDPLSSSQSPNCAAPKPSGKDSVLKTYQEAVITGTIMALVDWVLNMPEDIHNTQLSPGDITTPRNVLYAEYTSLLKTVFKVLQLVALEKPFNDQVRAYSQTHADRLREYKISPIKEGDVNPETIDMSYPVLPGSQEPHIHKNIKCCAEAALLVFCQRYHQFPLCGGPDYSSSMVYEYHREENGDTTLFSREQDLQILMMDKSSVISLVEFGKLPLNVEQSLDLPFESQPGCSRVIFRNVAGRFSWLSKKLFALKEPPDSPLPPSDLIDYTAHLTEVEDCPTLTPSRTLCRTDSGAPSLPSCPDSDRDCLFQTIDYIKATSPELPFYRELKKANRQEDLFNKVGSMLRNQKVNEENADNSISSDTPDNLTIGSDVSVSRSNLFEAGSPFQHCRSLASALSLLSWNKRYEQHGRQVELLDQSKLVEKEKDVTGALNELDNVFNREIHKFGLIYIARGDEKRKDALSHNVGSKEFEEFVAGLGWEVNWRDLHGFVPTIGTDVMKSTTVHYANATLETVFHVGTRLEPGNQEAALYRFKYIGNDYIGVFWSEHDRDVNIDTFKSAYLNYVIVIYPMRDLKKCRVQVIVNFRDKEEKCKIEHGIGPLFDGALVERNILPDLVRKTIINAERAITVDQNRPRFYRDRARNLDKLQNYKRDVTFEEFACELMSPSLINFDEYKNYTRSTVVETKQPPQRSGSTRIYKRTAARQSIGYSSQDNMSESERAEKKKKWAKRDLSDSDNVYNIKR